MLKAARRTSRGTSAFCTFRAAWALRVLACSTRLRDRAGRSTTQAYGAKTCPGRTESFPISNGLWRPAFDQDRAVASPQEKREDLPVFTGPAQMGLSILPDCFLEECLENW